MGIAEPVTGCHSIGWEGIWLRVPQEWNLSAFHGTGWKGWFVLSDLRGVRMMVRWRRPRWGRGAEREFEKLAVRLRRRLKAANFSVPLEGAVQVDLASGERLVVGHAGKRLVELQWMEAGGVGFDAEGFLRRMRLELSEWEWNVFGICGKVPAYARMKKADLVPGTARITWRVGEFVQTLGAISLADRLLKDSSLTAAAEKALRFRGLKGEWRVIDERTASFHGSVRRLSGLGRIGFDFAFTHDAEENRIRWNLTTKAGFHRIWRG